VFPDPPLSTGTAPREQHRRPAEGSLVVFCLSFRALDAPLELLATSKEVSSSSSRGIRSLTAPLSLDRMCVHSRKPRPPSARRCHPPESRSALVVSHHLDGFLHTWAAGLLHPADDSGVRRVSFRSVPSLPEGGSVTSRSSPRRESYPSKSSPRPQPYRITAAVALLPLLHALRARNPCRARPKTCRPGASLLAEACADASLPRALTRCSAARPPPKRPACLPDCSAAEAACQTPRGPEHIHRDRGRGDGVHRPPKWQMDSKSQHLAEAWCGSRRPTEAGARRPSCARATGASGAARCQTSPPAPLTWSS